MEEKETGRVKKRYIFITLVTLATITAIVWGINESKYVSTDDAYVDTHAVQIAPRVSGQIINVYVTDNQKIKEGELIAEIDPTDYHIKNSEAEAKYNMALFKQNNAKADFKAATSAIELAKKDLERYTALYNDGAVPKQQLDQAQINYDAAKAKLTEANQNLLSASNNRVADAELKQLASLKDQTKLNISYTKIYAPQDGYVTNKSVEKGAYIQTGQPLLTLVPDHVWVVANFKENQLEYMKPGQPVDIVIDTYPHKVFKGRFDSIQRSSGAKSSLFPPENAVGSFVKIVQRIPVKIVFDEKIDPQYTVVPGMSVIPKVRVK
ncbi:MAG: HlyD family secretion protein [Candidatus Gastranaerophilales bacterium]|nr:HlyD family secretion protein [Candidatus Gastranaerophilales bacterium]